jgi:outer membrane protein OmpA-like peptidoglycan-associated protein
MRVILVSVLVLGACGLARAQDDDQPTRRPSSQPAVTVNMDALDNPEAPVTPLARARPRAKPGSQGLFGAGNVPLPRPKPDIDLSAVPPETLAEAPKVVAPVAVPPVTPAVRTAVAPSQPAVPLAIVENFPVELSGVPTDPFASAKTVNPIEGFSVVSRIRFSRGGSELPSSASAVLDATAQKLLASTERVRLAAFSGRPGDYSSDARRLSLQRAHAVRAYLMSKGVPMDRMDVLPFGGATDGVSDRVDVMSSGG